MKSKNSVLKIAGLVLGVGLVLYFAVMAASALSGNAAELVYEKEDYTVNTAGIEEIRIRVRNMPVKVTPSDGSEITVHYYTCEKDPYEVSLDGGVLTLKYKNNSLFKLGNWFFGFNKVFNKSNPKVEVVLPAAYAGEIQLDTSNAPVNVSGLSSAGEVRIGTSNSPIEVNRVSAALLNARTSNGPITLDGVIVSGAVDMKSSNAPLTARQVAARDKLRMDTSNGRILVEQVVSADIGLNSSNGSISGSVEGKRSDYTISSNTSNGSDNLGGGGQGQFKLTVRTSNSNIDIRFLGE